MFARLLQPQKNIWDIENVIVQEHTHNILVKKKKEAHDGKSNN